MRYLLSIIAIVTLQGSVCALDVPPLASEKEVKKAVSVFRDWTAAYLDKRYLDQWKLTHPRIQRWHHKKRWRRTMSRASSKNGRLLNVEIKSVAPVDARKLPCTEMNHCYRKDMQVVIILLSTKYENAKPAQPEFVVMANSDQGWRYGGGTFPGRPSGETIVILDRKDELRYKPGVGFQN